MKRLIKSKSIITSFNQIQIQQTRSITITPEPIIDYQSIINHKSKSNQNLINRKSNLRSDSINDLSYLYTESKSLNSKLIEAKQRQNHLSQQIKSILNQQSKQEQEQQEQNDEQNASSSTSHLVQVESISVYHQEASSLKSSILTLTKDLKLLNQRLLSLGISIPNTTHEDVPIGSYAQSKVTKTSNGFNPDQRSYDFLNHKPIEKDPERDHLKIMQELSWISLKSGQNSTGSNFVFTMGTGALLELALIQYALKVIIQQGWKLLLGPDLVKSQFLPLCGFAPRDAGDVNQTYYVSNQLSSLAGPPTPHSSTDPVALAPPDLCLSATAEIPLISSFHSTILPNEAYPDFPTQPIKLVSLGTAFRSEAGARGLESKGLYRLHQFRKVELVCFTKNELEESEKMLQEMVGLQCSIIEGLGLPYRVLEMSSEELGNSAFHKFDVETWMPSRGRWGEITSASNCTDYQSRRMNIKFKNGKSHKEFVHTLNATGLAVPRIMMGLIEHGYMRTRRGEIRVRLPVGLREFWLGGDEDRIDWV